MTKAEKVALSLLIQKLKANNITVDPKNIVISDLDKGLFVINGATLTENKKVQIAFVYQTKGDIVTSLIVRTPVGDRKLTESIKLAEVSPAAEQAYAEGAAEKAAADKNRNFIDIRANLILHASCYSPLDLGFQVFFTTFWHHGAKMKDDSKRQRKIHTAPRHQVLEGLSVETSGMYIGTTDVAGLHHLVWEVV
jgi:hypothetical protein